MVDVSHNWMGGFWDIEEYSPNKDYCVLSADSYINNDGPQIGKIALIKGKVLLFKKEIQRPHDCHVSNDGVVICCDWQDRNTLTGEFLIFDKTGEQIFVRKTTANLGLCAISHDSKIAIFETYHSDTNDADKIFIVNVNDKGIIHDFYRPFLFSSAKIDTNHSRIKLKDHKGFVFEIDFEGNQTNTADYELQIMSKGSVYDQLSFYERKTEELRFLDIKYLGILNKGLVDSEVLYAFGKDKIYRKIGEYYEKAGDIPKTIENWEKALEVNPNIGIKRKLDKFKSKLW